MPAEKPLSFLELVGRAKEKRVLRAPAAEALPIEPPLPAEAPMEDLVFVAEELEAQTVPIEETLPTVTPLVAEEKVQAQVVDADPANIPLFALGYWNILLNARFDRPVTQIIDDAFPRSQYLDQKVSRAILSLEQDPNDPVAKGVIAEISNELTQNPQSTARLLSTALSCAAEKPNRSDLEHVTHSLARAIFLAPKKSSKFITALIKGLDTETPKRIADKSHFQAYQTVLHQVFDPQLPAPKPEQPHHNLLSFLTRIYTHLKGTLQG